MRQKKVLFVCVGNKFRSQLAAALYNKYTNSNAATSAGTDVNGWIHWTVKKVAREMGLDLRGKKPRMVTAKMIQNADLIITVCGLTCPAIYDHKIIRWHIPDTNFLNIWEVRRIAKMIDKKVKALVKRK